MQILVETNSKVEHVQELFNECYPFLKIEFYKSSLYNVSNKKEVIHADISFAQVVNKNFKAFINIKTTTTVAELVNDFLLLGINAEIFRRSGNVWVETFLTSNWTLDQQNYEGEEITRHHITDGKNIKKF